MFLFNGIGYKDSSAIIQPVLQWGTSYVGGGAYWAGACWYVQGDQTVVSDLVAANVNDTIVGSVDSATAGEFAGYFCRFGTNNGSEHLFVYGTPEMPEAVVALEVYAMTECSDYPDTPYSPFTQLSIRTHTGTPSISWNHGSPVTDCNQSTVVANGSNPGGEVDLYYRLPPLTVQLDGPTEIDTKGTYSWSVSPSGGNGSYTYQWVLRYDGGSDQTEGTSSTEGLTVYGSDRNFWWIVTVSSAGMAESDSIYVFNCIGEGSGCGQQLPSTRHSKGGT